MKTKVLAFCQDSIPSAMIGVNRILEYLCKREELQFKFLKTHEVRSSDIEWSDIVICIRGASIFDKIVADSAKKAERKLIYYLDDDLLLVPEYASCYPFYNNKNVRNNLVEIIKESDVLWTNNKNIAKKYGKFAITTAITDVPYERLEKNRQDPLKTKERIKICFAGSMDHARFIEKTLKEPLRRIIEKYENIVEIYIIGAKPAFIEDFKNHVIHIPYMDSLDEYYSKLQKISIDIGLAPLPDTEFHACKYYNKFLEYSLNGIVGIYSNVDPFRFIIEDGISGILVKNNTDSWFQGIELLINDFDLLRSIQKQINLTLNTKFSYQCVSDELKNQIPDLVIFHAKPQKVKGLRKLILNLGRYELFNKICNGFMAFGLRYIFISLPKIPRKLCGIIFGRKRG